MSVDGTNERTRRLVAVAERLINGSVGLRASAMKPCMRLTRHYFNNGIRRTTFSCRPTTAAAAAAGGLTHRRPTCEVMTLC
jgi:hypothetical protein